MWKRSSVLEYGYIGTLTNVNDSVIVQYYRALKKLDINKVNGI